MPDELYLIIKKIVARLLGCECDNDPEGDLVLKTSQNRRTNSDTSPDNLLVTNRELRNEFEVLYQKDIDTNDSFELYTDTSFEQAIRIEDRFVYRMLTNADNSAESCIKTEDSLSGITYELSELSTEYCLTIILRCGKLYQAIQSSQRENAPHLPLFFKSYQREIPSNNWKQHILKSVNVFTIKITSNKARDLSSFQQYKSAFEFLLMYRGGFAINNFTSIFEIIRMRSLSKYSRPEFPILDAPPRKIYNQDALDYYRLGFASSDPFISYISYYHVLEFFFEKAFKEEIVDRVREQLTSPNLSLKDDDNLFRFAKKIGNELSNNRNKGYGNEYNELIYVISKYINTTELEMRIAEIEPDAPKRYETSKCFLASKKTKICWNDGQDKIINSLVKRVYQTRNALVHSKDQDISENKRYSPFADEMRLKEEIPLVRALAELVLISTGTIIE